MSTLETNSIGKYNGNNVSIDDSLRLKNYTTTQRDALTSVAGDMIFNTTTSKVEYYDGSAWASGIAAIQVQYVIVGGGGSGAGVWGSANIAASGAGAGGYVSSVIGENSGGGLSSHQILYLAPSTNYPVSVGAGGSGNSSQNQHSGYEGNASYFNNIVANGGGAAQSYVQNHAKGRSIKGGSGAGRGTYINHAGISTEGGDGLTGQGYDGGSVQQVYNGAANATGGGGGASAAGANGSSNTGGDGGAGVATSISGSSVTYAGGGGGSGYSGNGSGGAGGGADGAGSANGNNGTANTGGGAGGMYNTNTSNKYGGNGGSGIVILRYPNTYTISQSGLTISTSTTGNDKVTTITAGTGTVSWA